MALIFIQKGDIFGMDQRLLIHSVSCHVVMKMYGAFSYFLRATCPARLILLDLMSPIIQGDRKVTRAILKYSLRVTFQYNSIGLINTISL
jgi:hypothetical protein